VKDSNLRPWDKESSRVGCNNLQLAESACE
jgi:hypothetical protein